MPLKRATESASRATGAIERFIERTLAPRMEEIAGEVHGMRGEMQQFDQRLSESIGSLRNEMQAEIRAAASETHSIWGETQSIRSETQSIRGEIQSLRTEMQAELRSVRTEIEATNTRIDAFNQQVNTRFDALGQQVNTRIDALSQRLDDALDIRERLVAVETELATRGN